MTEEELTKKVYLGDSVYARLNACRQIELTTENGYGPINTIILEQEVLLAFLGYLTAVRKYISDEQLQ